MMHIYIMFKGAMQEERLVNANKKCLLKNAVDAKSHVDVFKQLGGTSTKENKTV